MFKNIAVIGGGLIGLSIAYKLQIRYPKINLDEGIDELKRKIRSTSMPGFEPPFFMFNNKKFYITSK